MAMFELLSEEEFDKITVNDICLRSEYPRATFYNYFDDKLDLLQYLWSSIAKNILEQLPSSDKYENNLVKTFNLLLKFFNDNPALLANIKKTNGANSHLWHNMSGYLKHEANKIVYQRCIDNNSIQIPARLLSRYYSDLIISMLEWCLFENPEIDLETADRYLMDLLQHDF